MLDQWWHGSGSCQDPDSYPMPTDAQTFSERSQKEILEPLKFVFSFGFYWILNQTFLDHLFWPQQHWYMKQRVPMTGVS